VAGVDESALTDTASEDHGIKLGEWNELVRRARIGRERKLAALAFGSYADADGTGIHCGTARFALDCEVSYATARRYLAWMREVGLVEKVAAGNKRRGLSDEYRLVLGEDLMEHVDLPDPEQYRKMRDEIRVANREGSARRSRRVREGGPGRSDTVLRSPKTSAEHIDGDVPPSALTQMSVEVVAETDLRSSRASAEGGDLRSPDPRSALTHDEHPPTSNTSPLNLTSPLREVGLRTDVAVTRARAPEEQDFSPSKEHPGPNAASALTGATHLYPRLRRPGQLPDCADPNCYVGSLYPPGVNPATASVLPTHCPTCYILSPEQE
jgi:hypothetical protein